MEGCLSVYRMLVQFGLMRGLIRHLQKYPVLGKSNDEDEQLSSELQPFQE